MILLVFYILAVIFGYLLMFLFIKYFEHRKIYYIAWVISMFILLNLSAVMGDSYFYIFEVDNYSNISIWLYTLFMMFLLVPSAFLIYPFLQFYKWLFELAEDFVISIMNMFVSKKRKELYYHIDNEIKK